MSSIQEQISSILDGTHPMFDSKLVVNHLADLRESAIRLEIEGWEKMPLTLLIKEIKLRELVERVKEEETWKST